MIDRETMIQKCFGIASLANARGQDSLDPKKIDKVDRYNAKIDYLIGKLVEYIKYETGD